MALPSWKAPRLYLSAQGSSRRWQSSKFYPAIRSLARLYRSVLRTRAALGLIEERVAEPERWYLGDYIRDVLPQVDSVVVRADRNDPNKKATAQLWAGRNVAGYLKYAENDVINTRLRKEHHMLCALPPGFGPELLKYGALGEGEAMLVAPILGEMLPPRLSIPEGLVRFLRSLPSASHGVTIEAHPWVQGMRERSTIDLDPWLEHLAKREWAVVVQHGDTAPWNLLQVPGGEVKAVDWEYGTLRGLPLIDLAHYFLHTAALLYRWDPSRAMKYAVEYFASDAKWPGLSYEEAQALVRLTAHHDHSKVLEVAESAPYAPFLQGWLRELWETKA